MTCVDENGLLHDFLSETRSPYESWSGFEEHCAWEDKYRQFYEYATDKGPLLGMFAEAIVPYDLITFTYMVTYLAGDPGYTYSLGFYVYRRALGLYLKTRVWLLEHLSRKRGKA